MSTDDSPTKSSLKNPIFIVFSMLFVVTLVSTVYRRRILNLVNKVQGVELQTFSKVRHRHQLDSDVHQNRIISTIQTLSPVRLVQRFHARNHPYPNKNPIVPNDITPPIFQDSGSTSHVAVLQPRGGIPLANHTSLQPDNVSQQDEAQDAATTISSPSVTMASITPYTYRVSNTAIITTNVSVMPSIWDHDRARVLTAPNPEPETPPHAIPTNRNRILEQEEWDIDVYANSVILPSEISFEDSLLPPEYQSAWGGATLSP